MSEIDDFINGVRLYGRMLNDAEIAGTRDLLKTDVFVALLDESTLNSPLCYAQMTIAKQLNLPMLYIIPQGTSLPLPEAYTKDVKHYRLYQLKETRISDEENNEIMKAIADLYKEAKGLPT